MSASTHRERSLHTDDVHPELLTLGSDESDDDFRDQVRDESHDDSRGTRIAPTIWGLTRIALSTVFLWAFIDKLFGLGHGTPAERAWLGGGSPTTGYLGGVEGPLAPFFNAMSGAVWADWAFMLGLLGIGVALALGVTMRIAAVSGALMLVLMWAASLPLENNPVIDDHIIYAIVLFGLTAAHAGRGLGFGKTWEKLALVKRLAILK